MPSIWESYQNLMDLTGEDIKKLQNDGYVILDKATAELTGYFIRNQFEYGEGVALLAKHQSEDGEENPW